MRADSTSLYNGDASFAVINACYVLTDQYRCILSDLGKEHHLTENEMLVLVHLALYPDARTQKKLQATNLPLSVSSICRMVDSLRRKGYLSTCLDENDRRSGSFTWNRRGVPWPKNFGSACISAWAMYFRKFQALMYRALQP